MEEEEKESDRFHSIVAFLPLILFFLINILCIFLLVDTQTNRHIERERGPEFNSHDPKVELRIEEKEHEGNSLLKLN